MGLTLDSEIPATKDDAVYAICDVATFREVVETGAEAGDYEDEFLASEQKIGHVPSSSWGPYVSKMLALAYVDTAHAWPGGNLRSSPKVSVISSKTVSPLPVHGDHLRT